MKQPFSSVYAQVVDLKLFSPGRELPRGLLWVVEQAPGAHLCQPLMLGWDELAGAQRCLWAPRFSSACGWLMCSCAPTPFPPSHPAHPPSAAQLPPRSKTCPAGLVVASDQTDTLTRGYWPSFNVRISCPSSPPLENPAAG